MNKTGLIIMSLIAAIAFGIFIGRLSQPNIDEIGEASQSIEREILYWKAPMDANYRRDAPGKSPMGMDLVPVYADEASGHDPSIVSINPSVINNLGVRTAPAEFSALSRRVDTVGYVGYDEDRLQHVHTRVDGWVEKLAVKATGDPVVKGQLLFELYSPTLVNAQEEYLAALNSRNTTLLAASRERLGALGVADAEIARLDSERTVNQLVSIVAQADGYAAMLGVREGIYITPSTDIMSIAALDQVWVLAEVFERQSAWIRVGQQANVELDYLPGQSWQGVVDYVYPELDPATRTLKVRLRFDNESQVLRPNMFARISIFGTDTTPVVHVPREALIRGGAVNRVVLALGDGQFRSQPVVVGIESGDRVEIRSGISAGDLLVTSGQFLIDSESNIESALSRMDESASGRPPNRVRIGAVVKGTDASVPAVTLQHGPVPEWSWPAMRMSFDVADMSMLDDLQLEQTVEVVVERLADGRHRITEVLSPESAPEGMRDGNDMKPAEEDTTDHSEYSIEMN